ncbi:unnamed protein product [Microthlaspi erraticum]|uniref:Uncharacterized protein n=1 Tax=Microthlaspi erraticum TaxID=1685480 RepID=A0A6D2J2M7_9BRAS|nr:unnamed protein product [Microthlaspi erraticum]
MHEMIKKRTARPKARSSWNRALELDRVEGRVEEKIRFRVKGGVKGKQHFSGLTIDSAARSVVLWPVELENSTGWSSRWVELNSKAASFFIPACAVKLSSCTVSFLAPHVPVAP